CVEEVGPAQRFGERLLAFGGGDEVGVGGHGAVGVKREAVLLGAFAEVAEVDTTVSIRKEDVLLIIAPLSDVMRDAGVTMRASRAMRMRVADRDWKSKPEYVTVPICFSPYLFQVCPGISEEQSIQ